MTLPILAAILSTVAFGVIAIFLSIREERALRLLLEKERKQKQRLYEIAILKEIQDRIGYSMDIDKIIDIITGSLKNIFPYSTASSLLLKDDRLVFKTYVEESVNHDFINQVKQKMLNALTTLTNAKLPSQIDDSLSGNILDDTNYVAIASYFFVPITIKDRVVGMISVASTKPHAYKDEETTVLYQIVNQASLALNKLQNILTTEKSKILALVGSLADGVFMVDTANNLIVINDAAKDFLKITSQSPTVSDVLSAFPATSSLSLQLEATMAKSLGHEEEVVLGEKTLQVFITPVLNPDPKAKEEVIGASVLLHDITLERSIGKMKEEFSNIMVHELRAPLSAMKASAELVMNQDDKLSSDERRKLLTLIETQAITLLDQVGAILDAAKLEAGKFQVNKTTQSLNDLIVEKIDMFRPLAQDKKITLQKEVPPTLPQIPFDKYYTSQVLNNLLSNSLKFTPEGGSITISAQIEDDTVRVSVKDTGIGIAKDKQGKLFSKFAQVVGHTNPSLGTGLGLYIVKGIIEAHGGKVSLVSEEGKGTTISFTLPISDTSMATSSTAGSPAIVSHPQESLHPLPPHPILKEDNTPMRPPTNTLPN
jgi:signal transduction histidine kinase